MAKNTRVEDAIQREKIKIKDFVKNNPQDLAAISFAKAVSTWENIFRWIANVLIYATWPNAERENIILNKEARQLWERIKKLPPKSPKRKKLNNRLKPLDPKRRILLGHTITINRHAPKGLEGSESPSNGSKQSSTQLQAKRLVSGHFKRQPYGPKSSLRKIIWREPYWVNKDADEALGTSVHKME